MKIRSVVLWTPLIQQARQFYEKTLGLPVLGGTEDGFCVQVGWSRLCFKRSDRSYFYHYCFLVPRNQFRDAFDWVGRRVAIIDIRPGQKTIRFKDWNADSFYFYDPAGNIAECIVHYDLENDHLGPFNQRSLLAVNEIGMGTDNIAKVNTILESQCASPFWKGNLTAFGTNGSAEGRILLPDYRVKDTWFPTDIPVRPAPLELAIESPARLHHLFRLAYKNGELLLNADSLPDD